MRIAAAVAALVAAGPLAAGAQDRPVSPLRVRKVVVYKHGVGYFEREGEVTGNQTVSLTFKAAQMKDLLKSLYAVDLNGGRISSISYDTKDPLSKQLEEILLRVPDGHALTHFLSQLQGARVEAVSAGQTVAGSVLGIEPVAKAGKEGTVTSYKLVLLRDDGKIQPLELLEVSELKILDEGLQRDLKRLLEIHLKSKQADRKGIVLHAAGEGRRTVRVGYILETPIWKTSYRLLFDEGRAPLLQGWAILENTTDEDWEDVDVSFVAGSPMSFIMDLYTAYYPARPEVPLGVTAAPTAGEEDKGGGVVGALQLEGRREARPDALRGRAAPKAAGAPPAEPAAPAPLRELLEASFVPAAVGQEVGDLFAYRAREKVSVRRGQAALVPILSERLEGGERALYYRASLHSRPMNAYVLKNATGLTLEAGPVTFFEGPTCVGEGILRKVLKKGMRAVVPYAVEAGLEVEPRTLHRDDPVTHAKIAQGVLTLYASRNRESIYTVRNRLDRDATVLLDHPIAAGFSLAEPARAEEETDGHRRFRVEIKAGQTLEFKVRETMPVAQQVALLGTPADVLRFHLSQRYLSESARRLLAELVQIHGEISRLRAEENELAQERQRLSENDARVRQNLSVLRDTPAELEMRQKYLRRLQESDLRLEQIRVRLKEAAAQRAERERDLSRKIQDFREE
ncbi:MAG TPA: DUF4139 domain-containing protein [Planctomycetota bacterium]|nr:DUF4139 domain-containing protein [Planctomycetota bacterium]